MPGVVVLELGRAALLLASGPSIFRDTPRDQRLGSARRVTASPFGGNDIARYGQSLAR